MAFINATGPVTFGTNEPDFIDARGRSGMDIIFSQAGNDIVFAGDGDDFVDVGDGDDVVNAGDGDDIVDAGPGNDTVGGGEGNDLLLGREGNDSLSAGAGNDFLFGDEGNDVIFGGADDDFLFGSDGNDILQAGAGKDTLTGGPGSDLLFGVDRRAPGNTLFDGEPDVFQFNFGSGFGLVGESSQGNDVIEFFEIRIDGIRISGLAESLDTNGNGLLEDDDARVDATSDGSFFVIDFNGVPLVDGGTAAGTLTLIGSNITSLEVPRDILFV